MQTIAFNKNRALDGLQESQRNDRMPISRGEWGRAREEKNPRRVVRATDHELIKAV